MSAGWRAPRWSAVVWHLCAAMVGSPMMLCQRSILGDRAEADFSGIGGVTVRVARWTTRLAARAAPRKNYGKRKHCLIAQRYTWLGKCCCDGVPVPIERLERIEHERRRTCHALQARLPRACR